MANQPEPAKRYHVYNGTSPFVPEDELLTYENTYLEKVQEIETEIVVYQSTVQKVILLRFLNIDGNVYLINRTYKQAPSNIPVEYLKTEKIKSLHDRLNK